MCCEITGSARTEGYYKISHQEKNGYLRHARGVQQSQEIEQVHDVDPTGGQTTKKKIQQQLREARSESRRWQSFFLSMGEEFGDLLKFNQLKVSK